MVRLDLDTNYVFREYKADLFSNDVNSRNNFILRDYESHLMNKAELKTERKKRVATTYNNNCGFVSCGHNRASIKVGNFSYLSFQTIRN
ncbi:hypothetical protein GCM10008088_28270 [Mesonia mobilis]|uniref:Uncharacterized protein n=1 Tax=Mesonia mobilis TaxID=369791 RepID=A0ABQ3C2A6_9FLAO|nr:hypothetical protein GCM10008088_28270 [Mesonia mobilis]